MWQKSYWKTSIGEIQSQQNTGYYKLVLKRWIKFRGLRRRLRRWRLRGLRGAFYLSLIRGNLKEQCIRQKEKQEKKSDKIGLNKILVLGCNGSPERFRYWWIVEKTLCSCGLVVGKSIKIGDSNSAQKQRQVKEKACWVPIYIQIKPVINYQLYFIIIERLAFRPLQNEYERINIASNFLKLVSKLANIVFIMAIGSLKT